MDPNLTDPAAGDSYIWLTIDHNLTQNGAEAGGGGGEGAFYHDYNGTDVTEAKTLIEFYQEHAPLGVAIDRLLTPIFYLIGLPSNPLCAYIWLGPRTRRSNSSAIYLGSLSLSHTMFLALHVFIELNYAWGIRTFDGYVSCELFYILYYLPQYLAPLLVLGFTVERYIAVCHPFVKERYCTVRRAVAVVLSFLGFCLLLSGVQGYLWTFDEDFQCCNHRPSLQRSDFPYYWTWVTELTLFGLAPLAALVFNILVLREIRTITARGPPAGVIRVRETNPQVGGGGGGGGGPGGSPNQNQNQASTITLLSVSFYLICTWLPATLVYSLERKFPFGPSDIPKGPVWERHLTYYTVRKFVEEVTLSNSACYFFIYYVTGKHFRTRFKEIVCPKRCLNRSSGICSSRRGGGGSDVVNGTTMTITAGAAANTSNNHYHGRNLVASRQHYVALPCRTGNGHDGMCVSSV